MRNYHKEPHNTQRGSQLRDFILGFQDGLVNVLGIILAVAVATTSVKIVLIAGLAATFAESLSMAAVAYTSMKAKAAHYNKEREREKYEIENMPDIERKEIRDIFHAKGFRGRLLDQIVKKITSNKKIWLETMMRDELNLEKEKETPIKSAGIVGFSAIIGSLVPLVPFIFLPVAEGIIASLVFSVVILFITGATKARVTIGSLWRAGTEMALIGLGAAIIGYVIGIGLNVII